VSEISELWSGHGLEVGLLQGTMEDPEIRTIGEPFSEKVWWMWCDKTTTQDCRVQRSVDEVVVLVRRRLGHGGLGGGCEEMAMEETRKLQDDKQASGSGRALVAGVVPRTRKLHAFPSLSFQVQGK
jgi:hypothetical protein